MKTEIINKKLGNILNDKTSGSLDLLLKVNNIIKNNYENQKVVNKIIDSIQNPLNEFQIINKYLNHIRKLNNGSNRSKLKSYLNTYFDDILNQNDIIFDKLKKLINGKNSILTLSNSKTVSEILKRYASENKKLKIFISESRPQNEGRILAKSFLNAGIKVELILDAMLPHFIPKVDAAIIGADIILKNGNVINKIGSLNAAILCKYNKKPFYVIASKEKISNQTSFKTVHKNSAEVWNYSNKKVKINNFYFEEIDKKLISKIITN